MHSGHPWLPNASALAPCTRARISGAGGSHHYCARRGGGRGWIYFAALAGGAAQVQLGAQCGDDAAGVLAGFGVSCGMLATTGPCSLDLQAATGWPLPAGATTADLCPRTCGGCQEDAAEADHPVYRASTCAGRLWQAGEVPRVHDIGLAMAPADFRWLVENQARKAVHGR